MKEIARPSYENDERALLGCLIFDADTIDEIAPLVKPDDFSKVRNAEIYRYILQLHDEGEIVDCTNLHHAMTAGHALEADTNLFNYLVELTNLVFFTHEAETYAKNIVQASKRWQLMKFGTHTVDDAYHTNDADAVLERAEQNLFIIGQQGRHTEWSSFTDISLEYSDKFERLQESRGAATGLLTGFTDLDFILGGGLQSPDLDIIAARPGMGKTALALTIADNAAFKQGKHVAIFSLEMGKEQLYLRLLAKKAKVESQLLRVPWKLTNEQKADVRWAINQLKSDRIFIEDTQGITTTDLRSKTRRLKAKHGVDLLIVDYLQLMQAYKSDGKRIEDRRIEIDEISRSLKSLAIELDIPVLALAQLSRAVESRQSKIPQLSDLRESGGLEQDADIVMFIYRDEVYNSETERKNQADIIVAKHRNGPTDEVTLYFEPRFTQFSNLEVEAIA